MLRPVFTVILSFVLSALIVNNSHAQDRPAQQELEEVMLYVHQNNPALYAAREELKATQELYPQARAGWLPSLRGEASLYATDIDTSNFGNGDGATTKDLTLSLDQPIWRGGRTFAETDRARDLIRAGVATLKLEEQNMLYQVVAAYMAVVRDRQLLVIYKRNEDLLRQELQIAQDRFNLGDLTETDVHQTKARFAKAQSVRVNAARNLYVSDADYEALVGMKVPADMFVPRANIQMPDDPETLVRLADDLNAELQIYAYRHKASAHKADAVFRELFPQISAFASINKQYDPQPGIISDSQVETIGVRASVDLFRGGSIRSRIREARADTKRQSFEIDDVKRRIRQDIITNLRSYHAAQLQKQTVHAEITASKRALDGVREEARMGQRTIQDILDADEDVVEAEVLLARAQHDEIVTKYALARSVGIPLLVGRE